MKSKPLLGILVLALIPIVCFIRRTTSLTEVPHRLITYSELPDTVKQVYQNIYSKTDYNDEPINLNPSRNFSIEYKNGIAGFSEWKRYFHIDDQTFKLTWSDTHNVNKGPYVLFKHELYCIWSENFNQSDVSLESYMVFNIDN